MICPECGHDVPDGHMYCDVCGKEFHMVPEFEPEIENQIDKTLSRLAKKIDAAREDGGAETRAKKSAKPAPKTNSRGFVPVLIVGITVAIVLCALIVSVIYKSADDYIRMAKTSLAGGRPAQALDYLDNALDKRPQDAEAILLAARALRETGEPEQALAMLHRIINSALYGADDLRSAYVLAGEICRDTHAYDELKTLIARCPYEDLSANLSGFLPGEVTAEPAGGTYEAPLKVTLLTSGDETVWYTLNGQVPDEQATRYSVPFEIEEEGTVRLQAVSVNAAGVRSSILDVTYEVEKPRVTPPEVLEDSGEYTAATRIVVVAEDGLKILYATGKDAKPDKNSEEYTHPIQMPIGDSYYHFVCMNEEGELSEVVSREYHLEPERAVSTAEAVQNVASELVGIGILENIAGRRRDGTGTLSFVLDGTVTIGNDGEFYFIREYLTNEQGVTEPTGLLYAVNTQTGLTRRLGYDSHGQMMLMQFR